LFLLIRLSQQCLECPISYHITCIPLSAKFHELALLCHEHSVNGKLPYLDPESSFQQQVEHKADEFLASRHGASAIKKRRRESRSKNRVFPVSGSELTIAETSLLDKRPEKKSKEEVESLLSYFCLPCNNRDEVYAKPPAFRHVHSLQYDLKNRPARIPFTGDSCHCMDSCGEDCYNRMLYTECFGDIKKKTATNCPVGLNCGNRQLSRRKFVRCEPKREHGRGWGLITLENIAKGRLVQEYVGEVIDAATKNERLSKWAEEHPNDINFYIMSLTNGWYVDAREVANLSRFINHSCDPNCIITPVNVGGYMRNAVMALRDINSGEFLSYDYHFETIDGAKFLCHCGSSKCRGTMKELGNSKVAEDDSSKSASKLWDEAKTLFEKERKFVTEYYGGEEKRRLSVAESVPEKDNPEELVANGPQLRNRQAVLRTKIFLWRNAVQGAFFHNRYSPPDQK